MNSAFDQLRLQQQQRQERGNATASQHASGMHPQVSRLFGRAEFAASPWLTSNTRPLAALVMSVAPLWARGHTSDMLCYFCKAPGMLTERSCCRRPGEVLQQKQMAIRLCHGRQACQGRARHQHPCPHNLMATLLVLQLTSSHAARIR